MSIRKLERIEDAGGRYKFNVWKNGNHVDGDLYVNCLEEAMELAKESNADEVEAAIWYSEDDYNNKLLPNDYFTVWHR